MPRLRVVVGLLGLGIAGCQGQIPVPTLPQLQEVGEVGEYGAQRVRAAGACRQASSSAEGYVRCMEQRGWAFIDRSGVYPAPQCWSLRTAGDPDNLPMADCFHQAPAASAP